MSSNVTNPFQQPKTATYFGQQVNIVGTTENNNIVIQFEDGTKKVVNRAELLSTSLFNWNQERIDENNQLIEKYSNIAKEAEKEKHSLWKQIRLMNHEIQSKCSEWGTKFLHAMNNEQKAEFKALRSNKNDLKMAATAAGNQAYSASLSAFMYACDNSNYA